ncbi:hypothetical protein B0T14DRAFT_567437 [Immersiella caudata]|uniref:Uncharacterized protein n=1 Tax=Immersiella caudata TaxID=314043 RepID=A0AA40C0S1_9PEZI|nr:hypothetical protein B0T14DRAFT_567437 [Immersiella caudata]
MNSYTQGYGPYFHNVRGRLFLTVEVPSPPINPFPVVDWQAESDLLLGGALLQYTLHEGLSAPPLNGAAPITPQPGVNLNTIGTQPGLIPPPNDHPIPDWVLDPLVPPPAAQTLMPIPQEPVDLGLDPSNAALLLIFSPPLPGQGAPSPPTPAIVDPRNMNPVLEATAHHINVAVNRFSCPLCFRAHATKRTFHRHLWTHHRPYAQQNNIPSEYEECGICHRNMRRDNLKRHTDTRHGGRLA